MIEIGSLARNLATAGAIAAAGLCAGAAPALADYPEKPIKLLIGFDPGGGADTLARTIGKYATQYLGADFDYAYKPGASGTIAINEMLKNNDPDGYALAVAILPHQIIPTQMGDIGYGVSDVNWLVQIAQIPNGVYVAADSPYQTLQDLIDDAKANPGKIIDALPGVQSPNYLLHRAFEDAAGIDLAEVHYSSGSEMYKALLGGETKVMITNTGFAVQQPDETRFLAVASEERYPLTPDTPTFREGGLDLVSTSIRGIAAPAGMPDEVVAHLAAGFEKLVADPGFVEDIAKAGLVVEFMGPEKTNAAVNGFIASNKAVFEELKAAGN
ncbi:tripartite tricarboxylate transporter substrate binding protein [Defluviimonas sp. WL0075]|uniref:Tripartite tricarboxylate transporter substrate binding protein n=1 Tax=Albidovulum sediminicola TaxID=2984331 RepID=A0ABT2Z6E8_9RHOB|nr:tripartite tricarboxylate transporter substrate binding protein [Defluviimonas sp. WL0075]MCV2866709.1 tripartite tricarboxylate transporter substrate binding protein [Defluviimonas sp. WL0075]